MPEIEQHEAGDDRAILAAAGEIDSAAEQLLTGAVGKAAAAVEVIDPAAAWAEIPQTVGGVLCMALPELRQVYNDKACMEWGKAMARLADKRGWSADGMPPEVSVGLASAMFVIPTVLAIKARRAAAQVRAAETRQGSAAEGVLPEGTTMPGQEQAA